MSLRRVAAAYASSLLNVLSGLLSNVVLMRVVAGQVEKAEFGQYMLVYQTVLFVGFVQLGLDLAAVRQIAEHLGRGDPVGAARVYRALVRFNRAIALGCVAVAGIAAVGLFWIDAGVLAPLVGLLGLSQAVQFAARPAAASLTAAEQLPVVNTIGVARSIGITCGALGLLAGGVGVVALPASELVGMAAGWAAVERYRASRCGWTTTGAEVAPLGPLLRFGAVAGLGGLAWTIEAASDVYLLQLLVADGPAAVAEYSFWARLPHLAFLLATQFVFSSFPTLATQAAAEPAVRGRFFLRLVWVTAGLGGLAGVGLALWLPGVMHYWLDGRFDRADAAVVSFAAGWTLTLRLYATLFGTYLLSGGHSGRSTAVNWVQAVVKVGVSVVLYQRFGMAGLFAGSAVAAGVSVVLLAVLTVSAEMTPRRAFVPLVVSASLPPVAFWVCSWDATGLSLAQVVCGILITVAAWAVGWGALMTVSGQLRRRGGPVPVVVSGGR